MTKAVIAVEAGLLAWMGVLFGHHVYLAVTEWNRDRFIAQDSIDAAVMPAVIGFFLLVSMGMLVRKVREGAT